MAKNIIPEYQLPLLIDKIYLSLCHIKNLYDQRLLSAPDLVGCYMLLFTVSLWPKSWKGSQNPILFDQEGPAIKTLLPEFNDLKDSSLSIGSFLSKYNLRYISGSSQIALLNWFKGLYPLQISFTPPTAMELLILQCQGQRVVTLTFEKELLKTYILNERDPLSFAVHDLIHAHHFFRDSVMRNEQLGFYKKIFFALDNGFFKSSFGDPVFQKEFNYLISDMNSVSLHLSMCLKSAMIHSFLRQNGLSEKEFMTDALKNEFETYYENLLNMWSTSDLEKESFLRLNENGFCKTTDGQIISSFFQKYSTLV